MEAAKTMPWTLVNGAMELSWFLAWAMFCTLPTLGRPFPVFESLVVFTLAALVTRFSLGRGWRIVQFLLVELLGLAGAALLLLHGLYYASEPLFDTHWLSTFWTGPREIMGWLILLLQLLLILLLWLSGAALSRRPRSYTTACNRFDLGLAAFFTLFLIKLVALTKGETRLEQSLPLLFVFPFFLCGLWALAMERLQSDGLKAFLPGYRGIGIVASFVSVVLIGTGAVFLFFLPVLTAAAEWGYHALTVAGRPLGAVLVAILRFIFGPRGQQPLPAAEGHSPLVQWDKLAPPAESWWMDLLEKVIGWGLWGLMLLGLAVGLTVLLYLVLRWLFSRTGRDHRPPQRQSPHSWWQALQAALAGAFRSIGFGIRGYPTAAALFGVLRGWSVRSGFPCDQQETPREWGRRILTRFPALTPQVERIIAAYHREVYGERSLDPVTLAAANAAWRFLRSPLRWPVRLKGWLADGSLPARTGEG